MVAALILEFKHRSSRKQYTKVHALQRRCIKRHKINGIISNVRTISSLRCKDTRQKGAKQPGVLNTRRMEQLNRKRNQFFHDALHKIASDVVKIFGLENDIRAIVLGKNKNWKQNCNLGHHNNQIFVQMPIATLSYCIKYKQKRMAYL